MRLKVRNSKEEFHIKKNLICILTTFITLSFGLEKGAKNDVMSTISERNNLSFHSKSANRSDFERCSEGETLQDYIDNPEPLSFFLDEEDESIYPNLFGGGGFLTANNNGQKIRPITDPQMHFGNRFTTHAEWLKSKSVFVSDVYGGNPIEIKDSLKYIAEARINSEIKSSYGGCGPLAMIGQFDFLARNARYPSINSDTTNKQNNYQLAFDVFKTTNTHEVGSPNNKNTLSFPGAVKRASNELLTNYGISTYDMKVSNPLTTKITRIKESIDNGIPAMLWTFTGVGEHFNGHFMNLYGYEEWTAKDKNGKTQTYMVFAVRENWGFDLNTRYMDRDTLKGGIWGITIFTPHDEFKSIIQDSNYGYEQQYFFYEKEKRITNGIIDVDTKRLRTGYILDENLNKRYIVLSPKRANAGTAYLEYNFSAPIKKLNFNMSLWSGLEGVEFNSDTVAKLQYKNKYGQWIDMFDFLKQAKLETWKPNAEKFEFLLSEHTPDPVSEIRIHIISNPSGSKNKGRFVISNLEINANRKEFFTSISSVRKEQI